MEETQKIEKKSPFTVHSKRRGGEFIVQLF